MRPLMSEGILMGRMGVSLSCHGDAMLSWEGEVRRGRMRINNSNSFLLFFSLVERLFCLSKSKSNSLVEIRSTLSVAAMEVGKLVLVTPWADALREGYSSLEPLVRWALELDGWTLGLATLYAPFFLIFLIYVVNDYFRYAQSSSSSFNSRSVFHVWECCLVLQEGGDDEGRGDDDDGPPWRRQRHSNVNGSLSGMQSGRGGV
jgi:hypothetical protein